jgi:hypothetical protein
VTVTELFREIGTVEIVLAAVLANACLVTHWLLAPWWRSAAGRHAFSFIAALAVPLDLWALRLIVPDGDWFQFVRLVAFAAVPVVLAQRLHFIITTWRAGRRRRAKEEAL